MLGINGPSGMASTGYLIDAQVAASRIFGVTASGTVTGTDFFASGANGFRTAATSYFFWQGRSEFKSPADGEIQMLNAAETGFTSLIFGPKTSSMPMVARSGTGLEIKLADNSAYTGLTAGTITVSSARLKAAKGANVASAGDLTLGADGNTFHITGTTTINAITTTNWQAGSEIILIFDASVTVKNNTAGGASTAVMLLAGAADFAATANDVLKLVYDGTSWYEVSRSVN